LRSLLLLNLVKSLPNIVEIMLSRNIFSVSLLMFGFEKFRSPSKWSVMLFS
jgi:hypothetical protein